MIVSENLPARNSPHVVAASCDKGGKNEMKEIYMRTFDYAINAAKLLTPEIVQMIGSIHEHKGKQELFLEANIDELKTLLEVALIQSTGASNRMEGIYTSDARLWVCINWRCRINT